MDDKILLLLLKGLALNITFLKLICQAHVQLKTLLKKAHAIRKLQKLWLVQYLI